MVTVIIPAYKRPYDLKKALMSLEIQTDQNFKVLVSDDHSPISLQEVCDEFASRLKITYIRSEKNRGCGGNRYFALDYFFNNSPTEYLMFLDSDDLLMPQAIARLNKAIQENGADLISTDIVEESTGPKQSIIKAEDSKTWLHGKIYRTQFLIDHNIQFDPSLTTNEDLAFNLSLYAHDLDSYLLSEQLYLWRTNTESITRAKGNNTIRQKCFSIDYIKAIYSAYKHYKKDELSNIMIANILHCYNFWQRAVIYNTLTDEVKQQINEMLHNPQVVTTLFSFYQHPDTSLKLDAWCLKDESLVFFGQTYGQWIMKFFTPAEILQAIKKSKKS